MPSQIVQMSLVNRWNAERFFSLSGSLRRPNFPFEFLDFQMSLVDRWNAGRIFFPFPDPIGALTFVFNTLTFPVL